MVTVATWPSRATRMLGPCDGKSDDVVTAATVSHLDLAAQRDDRKQVENI
jgi:hypothetical protein